MIRRHPWRTLTAASLAVIPIAVWAIAIELWWAYQGRKRYQP